ncbi:MAG: hypothetical protein ACRYGF_18340 [Janthinobacterium lividum]
MAKRTEVGQSRLLEEPAQIKSRDRKGEDTASRGQLALAMAELREAREDPDSGKDLMQVAQVMISCGLPNQKADAREITRQARMGNGDSITVTFKAMVPGIDMPYGADRTLFHWMTHQAILTKDPFIPRSSASQFLNDMEMTTGGPNIEGSGSLRTDCAMAIVVERRHEGSLQRVIMPLVRATNLPDAIRPSEQMQLLDASAKEKNRFESNYGFRLDDAVFKEFTNLHVPVLRKLLQATRQKSQMQDYMMFLVYRSYGAMSTSCIPWSSLLEQLWHEDSNTRRIPTRMAEAIEALRIAWPEINADATAKGLTVGPPRGGKLFLARGEELRRLPR